MLVAQRGEHPGLHESHEAFMGDIDRTLTSEIGLRSLRLLLLSLNSLILGFVDIAFLNTLVASVNVFVGVAHVSLEE